MKLRSFWWGAQFIPENAADAAALDHILAATTIEQHYDPDGGMKKTRARGDGHNEGVTPSDAPLGWYVKLDT